MGDRRLVTRGPDDDVDVRWLPRLAARIRAHLADRPVIGDRIGSGSDGEERAVQDHRAW
jgi:hypothetical protein